MTSRLESGPVSGYDIIGDIHGCFDELSELLDKLASYSSCGGVPRKITSAGDLVDRGPRSDLVLERMMDLADEGRAIIVEGNHDNKLRRLLAGNPVKASHDLQRTLRQIEERGVQFRERVLSFLLKLPYKYEDGELMVVHGASKYGASPKEEQQLAIYGEVGGRGTKGEPIRLDSWAHHYDGPHRVIVRGHTVVPAPTVIVSKAGTLIYNIDTGCAFGGELTALRYPEMELVSVKSRSVYAPIRTQAVYNNGVPGS